MKAMSLVAEMPFRNASVSATARSAVGFE